MVGRLYATLGPDDLVLIVSSHGMEPLTPPKRLLERLVGDPIVSGTHERAPDGFVMAFGAAVRAARPDRGSVADVTPTILYFLGLPDRPRHGRHRPHRLLRAVVHRDAARDVHSELRALRPPVTRTGLEARGPGSGKSGERLQAVTQWIARRSRQLTAASASS